MEQPADAVAPRSLFPPRHFAPAFYLITVGTLLLEAVVAWRFGIALGATFVVLGALLVLSSWFGSLDVDDNATLTLSSIILLAAAVLLGPAAAGLVGALTAASMRIAMPLYSRILNGAIQAASGIVAGLVFEALGSVERDQLVGTASIIQHLALPAMIAHVAATLVNMLLFIAIVAAHSGRTALAGSSQVLGLIPAALSHGAITIILVVLWVPAGVGPGSLLLVLAPLLVAQWAHLQYAEEKQARDRALHVLVAAVEAKAPHLSGHSERVSELTTQMAEHMGLRPQVVADVKMAGMLHDLGQVTLPTNLVRGARPDGTTLSASYPSRGASLLRGLPFLTGSLDPIARHRVVLEQHRDDASATAPLLVGVADEFDLLTEVGTPDGTVLSIDEALDRLREGGPGRDKVVDALQQAVTRRDSGVVTG